MTEPREDKAQATETAATPASMPEGDAVAPTDGPATDGGQTDGGQTDAPQIKGPPRPARRVRRTRSVDRPEAQPPEAQPREGQPPEAASAARPDSAEGRPRERRREAQRLRPPARGPRRDQQAGGSAPTGRAVGQTSRQAVYTQDIPAHLREEAARRAAEEQARLARESKEAKAKKNGDQTVTTLLLHPPPRAAAPRHKKKALTPKEALKAKTARRGPKAAGSASGGSASGGSASGGSASGTSEAGTSEAGSAELQAEWVGHTGPSAVESLLQAVSKLGGDAAEALVKAWLDASNVDAIAHAAGSDKVTGKARKAARRALAVLRARGVDIPEVQAKPSDPGALPVALAQGQAGSECVASLIPPDPSGTVFFSLSQRQAGGRYRVADVMVRAELGVVHASTGQLPGKQIRRWKNRVQDRFGTAPIEVPLDWARYRIAQARRHNEQSRHLVPLAYESCSVLLDPVPDTEPTHPVADLEGEATEEQIKEAAGDSEGLHRLAEFAGWLPDKAAIDELLAKVGERVGQDNAGDTEVVDKVLGEELSAATDRFFTPELRAVLADRMRDSAISVRHRAGDPAARRVLLLARAIREAGLITSPPSDIPFLVGFFRKAVALLAHQGGGRIGVPARR